ncbi:transferase, partial [Actinoplanes sp. NPDC024001]
ARLLTGRRGWSAAAGAAAAAWAAGTAEFAAARIVPGPRDPREVTTMLVTSVAIPPAAVTHWLRGWLHWRSARPMPAPETILNRSTPDERTAPAEPAEARR